jgi:hypothetical protein
MIERKLVYEMLDKENAYAQGWNRDKVGHDVGNDQRWGFMDWIIFAEKYLNEAKDVWANYTPDDRAVRIRLLKAASLLITALQVHGTEADLQDIAGVSSQKFPIFYGGLKTFMDIQTTNENG